MAYKRKPACIFRQMKNIESLCVWTNFSLVHQKTNNYSIETFFPYKEMLLHYGMSNLAGPTL